MNSLVSIIVPTFNSEDFISETLTSISAQSYKNWECIVIDDGSSDATHEIVSAFAKAEPKIHFVTRPQGRPKGANACRNIGIEHSKGEYIMFLDGDDLLATSCLENRINEAHKAPDQDMLVFKMSRFNFKPGDVDEKVGHSLYDHKSDSYLKMFLTYRLPWPITAMFIRKSTLKITFNEALSRMQDVDFSIRLLLQQDFEIRKLENIKPDCFYRTSSSVDTRFKNPAFLNGIISSMNMMLRSIVPIMKTAVTQGSLSSDHLPLVQQFYRRNFIHYILPNIRLLGNDYVDLRRYLKSENIISFQTNFQYSILEKMYKLELHKKKGTGAYKLTKKWLGAIPFQNNQ